MITIDNVRDYTIFEAYTGSYAYGTYVEGESDKDIIGVYVYPYESIEQLIDPKFKPVLWVEDKTKDHKFYELSKFIDMLSKNNPNIVELLFTNKENIIKDSHWFQKLRNNSHKIITKKVFESFNGYAITQYKKAKSLKKLINWEKDDELKGFTKRKNILDFCFVAYYENNKYITKPFLEFIDDRDINKFGLTKLSNFKDSFQLFYDETGELGYKGLINSDNKNESNQLKLSSIPKGEKSLGILYFNLDSYKIHCKKYREYTEWLEKRNQKRYSKEVGFEYNGKNMSHCFRLLDCTEELMKTGKFTVNNPNKTNFYLDIKNHKIKLEPLMKLFDTKKYLINKLEQQCNLPDLPDNVFLSNFLINTIKEVRFNQKNLYI